MSTNFSVPDPTPKLIKVAEGAKEASISLGQSTSEQRCEALTEMANALNDNADEILNANISDLSRSIKFAFKISSALLFKAFAISVRISHLCLLVA